MTPCYRALLFDVMGTVVYEPFFEVVPAALGMTLHELLAAKHPTAWVDFEKGKIDEDTFRRSFFADGRDYDHDGMKAAMVDAYHYLDGMEAILGELAVEHELHWFSNYPEWYQLIEDKLELSGLGFWSFVSCELGVRKPDPEIYRIAIRTLEAVPDAFLFVDDRESNCAAAREVGMDAIVFEDATQLRRELTARGLLPIDPRWA